MDPTLHHPFDRAFVLSTHIQIDDQVANSVGFERYVCRPRRVEFTLYIFEKE